MDNKRPPSLDLVRAFLAPLFPAGISSLERVPQGISTYVYRLTYRDETFYLRLLPEQDASFAPEVAVHSLLQQRGVQVPRVLHFEDFNETLQHSIMLITEIRGVPLSTSPELTPAALAAILHAAGRDLAHINSLPVSGFGWVKRCKGTTQLEAELPTNRSFALEYWDVDLAFREKGLLSLSEIRSLTSLLHTYDAYLDCDQGWLAHGDFDTTHIYHVNGNYTGIIDFGEIRGTGQLYDLAHFHMRDGELLDCLLLPNLLKGYQEITPLPHDYQLRLLFDSLLINIRSLARALQKRPPNRFTDHQLTVLREDLKALLAY